jgi:hypothetical protein
VSANPDQGGAAKPRVALWKRLLPWAITIVCFGFLYFRIEGAAQRQDPPQSALAYLSDVFASVDWMHWLALMIPYSFLYLLIDTAVLWRVVNWFNTRVPYQALLPVRASSYIISILNEQVGKGAIAVFLNRRDGVPGWQIGSSILFIMFCEFYYLLFWAVEGVSLRWNTLPAIFHVIPWIAVAALIFFAAFVYYFRSPRFASSALRERQLLLSFRKASPWYYLVIIVIRSPALVAAAWVYSEAAALFGMPLGFLDMLGYLPVIFFGTLVPGPFRAVAVTMWSLLLPDFDAGRTTAFGIVQHNFFVLFNAAIGLVFLRRVSRDLFGTPAEQSP